MDPLATAFAASRIALGATALVAPGPVCRAFGLDDGPKARLAGRYLGGRDLTTGVGMVLADRHGSARGWFEAAALIDLIDAGATIVAGATGAMPRRRALAVTLVAAGSAALAAALARRVDEPTEPPLDPPIGVREPLPG